MSLDAYVWNLNCIFCVLFLGDPNDSSRCVCRGSIKHSTRDVFNLRRDNGGKSTIFTSGYSTSYISSSHQHDSNIWLLLFLLGCVVCISQQRQEHVAQYYLLLQTNSNASNCSICADSCCATNDHCCYSGKENSWRCPMNYISSCICFDVVHSWKINVTWFEKVLVVYFL